MLTDRNRARGVLIASLMLAISLLAPSSHGGTRRHSVAPAIRGTAEVQRIVVVVLENTDAADALRQPFLSELAARGAILTNYHALAHPSQPNYIAMVAGSAYGIVNDDSVTLDVPHLGDLIEAHGRRWKTYAEDYPGGCFPGKSQGNFVRRHVPFLSFANVTRNADRCNTAIVNATGMDADIATGQFPDFAFYVPDLKHDGHDTSVAVADAWLRDRFGPLLDDLRFSNGTLLIVTFDEGTPSGSNIVYCSFYGAGVAPGSLSADYYDHYSLLRTIEEIFRLGTLHQHDETADRIRGIWR